MSENTGTNSSERRSAPDDPSVADAPAEYQIVDPPEDPSDAENGQKESPAASPLE